MGTAKLGTVCTAVTSKGLDRPFFNIYNLSMNIQPKDTSKGHFLTSLAKSILRIGAGVALLYADFESAGALFIFAEILGIIEELV